MYTTMPIWDTRNQVASSVTVQVGNIQQKQIHTLNIKY